MSSLRRVYRRGVFSFAAGAGLVAYGAVASARLFLLIGVAVIAWGVVRVRWAGR